MYPGLRQEARPGNESGAAPDQAERARAPTRRKQKVLRTAMAAAALTSMLLRRTRIAAPIRACAVFLIACCVLGLAYASNTTRSLDDGLAAWRSHLTGRAPSGSLVVVEIDTQSLRQTGEWPWPRSSFAQAIRNLHGAGAGLIGIDVDFSLRSSSRDDDALRDALGFDPGSVILPTFLQRDGQENSPLSALTSSAIHGAVNIPVDVDGQVRRYNRGFRFGTGYHASMAATLAGADYGDSAPFLIDFGIRADGIERLRFGDVLRGEFDPKRVRGKTILIGATALELGDEFSTPMHPTMPGVYIHALAYESLLQGRAMTRVRDEVMFALALCVLVLLWPRSVPLDLNKRLIRHAAVLSLLVLGPVIVQAVSPVSIDVGLVLVAQLICVLTSVYRELVYRAAELARQREVHLRFIAFHDPETLLPNRRAMIDRLAGQTETGSGAVVAIAVGIDRFPTLRGAIGYVNANQVMVTLAARLSADDNATEVYHLSTSILGVVLLVDSETIAREKCATYASAVTTDIPIENQDIEVAFRVGAAVSVGNFPGPEKLLEQATIALDHARAQNRRNVMYDAAYLADPVVQLALTSDIRKGLARGEFSLVFQPKYSVSEQRIVGAEALLRWTHPLHGEISPSRFIGAAEDTGAIHELTRWVLAQAIEDQATLRSRGIEVRISVNLSARNLGDGDFCRDAVALVRRTAADICFEITETAIIDDPQSAIASIAGFIEAGIGISIDDYGTGLSSLSYLKQIAADELKLDRSLVGNLTTSARDRLILKSAIDLAHSLDMSVVAEGVEDADALAIVTSMGCDCVQSFLISRPLPLGEFSRVYQAMNMQCEMDRIAPELVA